MVRKKTFAIDSYSTRIKVGPYENYNPLQLDKSDTVVFQSGRSYKFDGDPKTVFTATRGKLERSVKFSKRNKCTDLFDIRYGTTDSGAIIAHHKIENEEDPALVNERLRHAQSYFLKFTPPQDGSEPYLDIDIFKGFDRGNRNAHFHLYDFRKKKLPKI